MQGGFNNFVSLEILGQCLMLTSRRALSQRSHSRHTLKHKSGVVSLFITATNSRSCVMRRLTSPPTTKIRKRPSSLHSAYLAALYVVPSPLLPHTTRFIYPSLVPRCSLSMTHQPLQMVSLTSSFLSNMNKRMYQLARFCL